MAESLGNIGQHEGRDSVGANCVCHTLFPLPSTLMGSMRQVPEPDPSEWHWILKAGPCQGTAGVSMIQRGPSSHSFRVWHLAFCLCAVPQVRDFLCVQAGCLEGLVVWIPAVHTCCYCKYLYLCLKTTCQCRRHKWPRFDPWVGKIPWKRSGNPLQYSCLKNSMDRRAWQATVHRITKSQTRLSQWAHSRLRD